MTGGRLKRVAAPRRRRDLLPHLRRLRRRPRHDEAARVPPRRGRARDADRVHPPGRFGALALGDDATKIAQLRREARGRRRLGQRRLLRARARRASTTSTATRRLGARAARAARRRRATWPPTGTMASGRTWTACATRWCSRSTGRPGAAVEDLVAAARPAAPAARRSTHVFVDLGSSPLANSYLRRRISTKAEPFYPLTSTSAASASSCSSPSRRRRRRSSATTPTSPRTPTAGCATREAYVESDHRAARARRRRARSSRSPATTATCCSTSSSAACRCSASSRRRTSPRRRSSGGHPDARSRSSARRPPSALRGRGRRRRPRGRQQRARPRAGPERLRRRAARSCSSPSGVATFEFPHLLRLIERQPVRHDLPRALLVLLAARRAAGVRRARPRLVRRRGAAHATAARCASTCATTRRSNAGASGSRSCWHASEAAGLDRLETLRAPSSEQVRATEARPARAS